MKVGWIGMGRVGKPMALRVLQAGYPLIGYVRRTDGYDDVRAAGGVVSRDLDEVAAAADILCVNLYSEAQVREVMFEQQAMARLRLGAILVIHSTVSPGVVKELAALREDVAVLDAGFSGTGASAAEGQILLMVGGGEDALAKAEPVLRCYSSHIALMGPLGSGMALKVINNLLFAAHTVIARDALRLVEQCGLAVDAAAETLSRASASSTALKLFPGRDVAAVLEQLTPVLIKDVAIARDLTKGMALGTLETATHEFA